MSPERLAEVAAQLVARVRDDDPQDNARWLVNTTSDEDRWGLLFVLAAMVDDSKTIAELVAWTGYTETRVEKRRRQWREAKDRAKERENPSSVRELGDVA